MHEVGAAITIKPNASRVLQSWDFVPETSGMVAIRKGSLIDGTNMEVLVPNYYKDCESTWGLPMYAVHRVDLHSQLRQLATQKEGPGRPCDVLVRSKVVDYVSERVCQVETHADALGIGRPEWKGNYREWRGPAGRPHCRRGWRALDSREARPRRRGGTGRRHGLGVHAVAGSERGLAGGPGDRTHDPGLVHEVFHGGRWSCWPGVVSLSKVCNPFCGPFFGSLLTGPFLLPSNEVQNFLYLSREFDTSHVGEGNGNSNRLTSRSHCPLTENTQISELWWSQACHWNMPRSILPRRYTMRSSEFYQD